MVHLNLKRRHFIGALLLVTLMATFSWAQQPVHSVQELQSKLNTDDELKVIDRNGKTSVGRLVSISGSSLTLIVRGARQEFSETTIREIKQRRPHGVRNVLLGAAIGGVAGGLTSAAAHPGADAANSTTTSVGALIGSGIGAGVVALKHLFTRRYDTVFMASGTPGS
jgi:uncharacterized protein YcfJ